MDLAITNRLKSKNYLRFQEMNALNHSVTVNYIAEDANSAYFMITEQTTGNAYNHIIDTQEYQNTIDVTSYPTGIYLVSLICDGNLIETKQLLIE